MDDERIQYYPFRDDVKEILNEFDQFAEEYINEFYLDRYCREKIRNDKELQSWVQEISAHSNGIGNVRCIDY